MHFELRVGPGLVVVEHSKGWSFCISFVPGFVTKT